MAREITSCRRIPQGTCFMNYFGAFPNVPAEAIARSPKGCRVKVEAMIFLRDVTPQDIRLSEKKNTSSS